MKALLDAASFRPVVKQTPGEPYEFIELGPGVSESHMNSRIGDIHGSNCYNFIGHSMGICFMVRNSASGPEIGLPGRISAGF